MIKPLSSMTKNRCFLTKFVRSDPVRQKTVADRQWVDARTSPSLSSLLLNIDHPLHAACALHIKENRRPQGDGDQSKRKL